jgi:hypothetical protein
VKFRSAATACLIVLAVAAVLGLAILPFFGHGGTVRIYADQAPGLYPHRNPTPGLDDEGSPAGDNARGPRAPDSDQPISGGGGEGQKPSAY